MISRRQSYLMVDIWRLGPVHDERKTDEMKGMNKVL